jgi:LacI family transcriptional regulator, galactose operon repressor
MGKATLKDVIKVAQVSLRTASRVINNDPTVGPTARNKVLKAIETLDYKPNMAARGLRSKTSFMIGVAYDNPNAHYIVDLQNSILESCEAFGYGLQIIPCRSDSANFSDELCETVKRSRLAGLVLTPPISEMPGVIEQLTAEKIHFVSLSSGNQQNATEHRRVLIDDYIGAYRLTSYLVELKHREIGFVWGEQSHKTSRERYRGYRQALRDHGISPDPQWVMPGEYSFESGYRQGQQLLRQSPRVSAIFASNDEIAAGVLAAARDMNIRVPNDLSVVGFENSPFSRRSKPRITTANLPVTAMGRRAADLLFESMHPKNPCEDSCFEAKVIIRESTAAKP